MRVAYLINQYPSVSHTFIRREIAALERAGVEVARFAVRPSKEKFLSDEDREEASKTRHILSLGTIGLLREAAAGFFAAPAAALAALGDAMALGWRSEAGLLRHKIYWLEALALSRWLRAAGLRHAHAHFGTNSATVAMLAARISGGGFSVTVHGPEEFDKPGLIGLRRKIERARFVVGVSSYGASQLRRLVDRSFWTRIKIVHCGIEMAFHDGAAPASSADPVFVCVGRLSEQKGQLTLVEAAAMLKREGRVFQIRLVGDGDMRGAIEAAARDSGVADRIVITGWKTPREVRAEIERARAFVLPSYAEGLPVSIMEAMSLAKPVISTYVAGIPELVLPGENGWLAPAADAEALACAMRAALDAAPGALSAMGEAGKARVLARHDIETEAGKLKALFAEALGETA
ncbi:MAG: glycosyltransferase [Pseudomonadota bacterium]|nr:glycosyltransferase [Pseudomonadota bacterium]